MPDADRLDQLRHQLSELRDEIGRIEEEVERLAAAGRPSGPKADTTPHANPSRQVSRRLTETELESQADQIIERFRTSQENGAPVSRVGCWTIFLASLLVGGLVLVFILFRFYP